MYIIGIGLCTVGIVVHMTILMIEDRIIIIIIIIIVEYTIFM